MLCKALDNVFHNRIPTRASIVVQMSYMLSKNYTTYEYFTQHMTKIYTKYKKILDKIYICFEQHMIYFTQDMKIFYTTYETNLYNI